MRKISKEELKAIIENHEHWILKDCNGWENMRADLSGADLSGVDLRCANLCNANLRHADLRRADLSGANLYCTSLYCADLSVANLRNADIRHADLRHADLRFADLSNASLSYTDLFRANFRYAKNIPFIPMVCPDTGSFIAWKKASDKIVKIKIPEFAKRSSATGRKCRCNEAIVLGIENMDGTASDVTSVCSSYDSSFVYTVGHTVSVENFDEDRFNECAPGIHFFINRQEAVDY